MSDDESKTAPDLDIIDASTDDADIRTAVLHITHTAFLINPETGQPIEGDTPTELPMVETMFERQAIEHLHIARLGEEVAAYIIYTRGTLT